MSDFESDSHIDDVFGSVSARMIIVDIEIFHLVDIHDLFDSSFIGFGES